MISVDQIVQMLSQDQPGWVLALAALIPLCMLLSLREFLCWFWKVNKLVNRLERIEQRLGTIERAPAPRAESAKYRAAEIESDEQDVLLR